MAFRCCWGSQPTSAQPKKPGTLSAEALSAALAAVPLRVEIRSPDGAILFTNREGMPPDAAAAVVTPLPGGLSLAAWLAPGATHVKADEQEAPAFLDDLPTPAWVSEPLAGGGAWAFRSNSLLLAEREAPVVADGASRVHPEDAPRVLEAWACTKATGAPLDEECRVRRGDGTYTWVLCRAKAAAGGGSGGARGMAATRIVGIEISIHSQKEAEAQWRDERQRLGTVLDNLPVSVVLAEVPSGKLVFENPRQTAEVWGGSIVDAPNAAQSTSDYDRSVKGFHADGRPYRNDEWPLVRAIRSGEVVSREEIEMVRSNGTTAVLRISAAPVYAAASAAKGPPPMIAAIAVTEDVTTEAQLRRERMRLMAAEQAAQASAKMKSDFLANMSHELRTPIHGIIGLAGLLRHSFSRSADFTPISGGATPALSTASSGRGRGSSFKGDSRTISSRSEAAVLQDALPQLLDEPAGAQQQQLRAEQLQYCRDILDCATLLQSLVSDVLDYSKLDAGRVLLERIPIRVGDVVTKATSLMRTAAEEKCVSVALDVPPDLPQDVVGDPVRIKQVLLNLLSNAIKFAGDSNRTKGRVSVRVLHACTSCSRVSHEAVYAAAATDASPDKAQPRSCIFRIEVEDNGPGVPAEVAERLFSPFTQADSSTTRRFGGTGLGLSICKGLVSAMGGSIGVDSPNEWGGATFWCTLRLESLESGGGSGGVKRQGCVVGGAIVGAPATAAAAAGGGSASALLVDTLAIRRPSEAAADPAHRSGSGKLRILVVEDNRINRLIAQRLIGQLGLTADLAEDGRAGLDMAAKAQPPYALILMDCQMPVMDGFEATRAIRALPDPSRARVPVIALSASSLQADVELCLAAGMDDHVAKPVDVASLAAHIQRWLPPTTGHLPLLDRALAASVRPLRTLG